MKDWVNQVQNKPEADHREYNFAAISPGGALSAGVQATIILSPVPKGINATDTKHYLYISGGTGAAEAVLIQSGGTAVSGASSGTIKFTPANSHSGAWMISSATSGIAEAQQDLITRFGGGKVKIAAGNWTIYAAVGFQPNMTFEGVGTKAILVPATSSTIVFDGNVPVKPTTEYTLVADNIYFRKFVIDGSAQTGVNSIYGIRAFNANGSTELWSYFGLTVDDVDFNNVFNAMVVYRGREIRVLNSRLWCNSRLQFTDNSTAALAAYFSADILVKTLNYIWHPIAGNNQVASMTSAVVSFANCETAKVVDSYFSCPGAATNTGSAYGISTSGGEDYHFRNNTFINCYTALYLGAFTNLTTTYFTGFVDIQGNSIDQIWGPAITGATGLSSTAGQQVAHVVMSGNFITNLIAAQGTTAQFLNTGTYAAVWVIEGNEFRGLVGSTTQTGIVIGSNAGYVIFGKNFIGSDTGDVVGSVGVNVSSGAAPVYGLENLIYQAGAFGTNIVDSAATVASGAALTVPAFRRVVTVTGTVGITSMVYAGQVGDVFTLAFTGSLTVTKGGNLKINANFTSTGTAVGTLSGYWDGTNFIELSRSAN